MAEIKRYLYNDLSFKVATGITPIIVNSVVVDAKQTVPETIWNINFGKVDMALKNAIEATLALEPNDTSIRSYIGPHYYIGKRINPVGSVTEYYLTYVFEYAYYQTFVNKPLAYIVDGSDHLIEGVLRIPISQVEGNDPIVFAGAKPLPRKLFHLENSLDIKHEFNNIFSFKVKLTELAAPLAFTNLFIAGASDVDYDSSC